MSNLYVKQLQIFFNHINDILILCNRHDSRFHTFSSRPAKHSICCAWDFYECSLKHKNAGQSNDIKVCLQVIVYSMLVK